MLTILLLAIGAAMPPTVVPYKLPHCQSLSPSCDTVKVTCTQPGVCETLRVCIPETRIAKVRVYWQPQWTIKLLREKDVTGREGQKDTIHVQGDSAETIWITVVDKSGNESCFSNVWTVNIRNVGVQEPATDPPPIGASPPIWYDIAGRKYSTAPTRKGFYWEVRYVAGKRQVKKIVVIR